MLADAEDAYGHLVEDYLLGRPRVREIIERDDGLIEGSEVVQGRTSPTIATGRRSSAARCATSADAFSMSAAAPGESPCTSRSAATRWSASISHHWPSRSRRRGVADA